ncbi:aspartate/glutamate racemase family protein [Fluviibacterium sp. DFM31]|uniref:Aspartate/glutamate racemase family protein n=1 Tax=Meridianimarinicoccus marinus TaxID=3231483 RepID=A0ABV3L7W9_9RHOB
MRILIANPNMSAEMTALMVEEARTTCRTGTEIIGGNATFGVSYIATRAEAALAAHALLDLVADAAGDVDAVVVGAFCPGLAEPVKELLPVPVVGLPEAGFSAARLFGRRIGLIGIGSRARGMNEEILHDLGARSDVVSIQRLPLSGTDLAADPEGADAAVIAAGMQAVETEDADVLILGGAAFSGIAARVAPHLPVPVVPPVPYAISMLETALTCGWRTPATGTFGPVRSDAARGVGAALTARLRGG